MLDQELRTILSTEPDRVMIIIGAGVPLGALRNTAHHPVASWGGLIRDGLAYAQGLGHLDAAEADTLARLLESPKPGFWISAAEQLTQALGGRSGGDFRAWLRRSVGAFASAVRDRSVLDVLVDLERRGATLATVNYDSLLEDATGLPAVTWREPSKVERVLAGDDRGILHLHGHWEDAESIVLGTSSYDEVVGDPHARAVLTSTRMLRTLVFVGHGTGLRDPNWGSFLDWTARVFAGSEYRHYRIAREAEVPELWTPELQAQRIALVGYPGGYESLGPFLRSLVPEAEQATTSLRPALRAAPAGIAAPPLVAPSEPTPAHVLLLVNIGENDHRFVSADDVRTHGGVQELAKVLEPLRRILDFTAATPRDWRAIARDIDRLIDEAEAATREANGPVCFVIAGAAPLPVFAYLGYHAKRLVGTILFLNRSDITSRWDHIGPFGGPGNFPPSLRTMFTYEAPTEFYDESGKMVLFVACSTIYKCTPELLGPVTTAEAQALRCIHRVTSGADPKSSRDGALGAGDLRALVELVSKALESAQERGSKSAELVLAFGGPVWVAFWLGWVLNARVGGSVELPNFIKGTGYVRALSSQMWRQRWVAGQPQLLVLAAEPDDEARTRAAAQLTSIQTTLEGARGRRARHHVHTVGSTKVGKLLGLLDREQPDILHIYVHGKEDGSLGFEDDRGDVKIVRPERLLDVLRAARIRPSLIVVCACHSAALAPALLELADCVVNVKGIVPYAHAMLFFEAFYAALARGRALQVAFEHGKAQAGVVLDPAVQPFELLHRPDVNPEHVVFWNPVPEPRG